MYHHTILLRMAFCCSKVSLHVILYSLLAIYFLSSENCCVDAHSTHSTLVVHASNNVSPRTIPNTFLGVFVEVTNYFS